MKVKYPSLPDDAIVNLRIVGTFYKALAQLVLALAQELTPDEYKKIVEKLKNMEPAANTKELNVMLVTALVIAIEQSAKEQDVLKEMEVDMPDEPIKD